MIAGSFPPLFSSLALLENGISWCLQLKSNSLQCLACTLHDLLSSESGASEGDLVNVWVGCDPWAEIIISAQYLDNTCREELLSKFAKLEVAVWCEWTRALLALLHLRYDTLTKA